ncbi:hypothetical protein QTI99_16025 [Clostridium perfringens]|uniref:hypothetical protein n=1 Tax=Clostridium perfringens TaxID=1502 RepID=UPI002ED03BB0|nr:hypothetical protein [Clostridium perfringens]MDM0998962.1 hypothetical protein [Clostridium perfringens]WVM77722.1 hypothetical protein V1680_16715 [Clostridium perfringens]
MITNKAKEEACIKYKNYLDVIDKLGNKTMLEKQLISLCVKLNIARDRFIVLKTIQDLEKAEVIKKINFGGSNNKIIIFKKYAIRFLGGFNSSQSVAAVSKVNSNSRYYLSYFKVQFILNTIIPSMKKKKKELNLDGLLEYIDGLNSNILYRKNNILEYYNNLNKKFKKHINEDEFNRSLELLDKEYINLTNNLGRKKIDISEDKFIKRNRKTKWDYLAEATIGTLIRKDIYIAQIFKKEDEDYININVYFFDVLNSQNIRNIILNYSICYTLFKRLFNCNIKLKFNYVAKDEIAKINVVNKLTKDKIKLLLRANNLNELEWQNMNLGIIESDK